MTQELDPRLVSIMKAVKGRKAENIAVLDVRELTTYTDYFILANARSTRQAAAVGEYIKVELKKEGITPLAVDGLSEGSWVLLDYGDVIVHVFYEETRDYYDLDGLWADAVVIDHEGIE
ncbi:ribosome silencing factor [Desulfoluna sp.]|uniref:ribosome silencing factor n=1 Tax=Desulfoluna sp. TaxID=2045199 RepID=UPI002633BFB1|nr:ribosome silencing factor [Desulfoluna sp.]